MKVGYRELRKIKLNSTMEFSGTPQELVAARVNAHDLAYLHQEEGRKYITHTDRKNGKISITALKNKA